MNFATTPSNKSESSDYLPAILPTSKLLLAKREERALAQQRAEQEQKEKLDGRVSRRNSSVHYRKNSLPPTTNMYDADVLPRRSDAAFSKGSKRIYGEMMSNGDMYTQTVMHNDLPSTTAYDPDYLRKSKPIRFDEEDSEDNTWIRVYGFQPEDVSAVLEQFQQCGYVAERRSTANNYMYLRFYTQLEVQKALALSGTRVNGNYIGVVACSREEVKEGYEGSVSQVRSRSMDTRDYAVKENEIYRLAPVKRISLCSWLSEKVFG
ncbi:hypothetical protein WA588_005454, partial [Blastocystis sp. NMH]